MQRQKLFVTLQPTPMMDEQPLNILCLDGGGVRGLSSLLILRTLMEQLKIKSLSKTDLKPCEVFHLICGTSTGGLIALMLGRLRMNVNDAITCYRDFSKRVFEEKSCGWKIFFQSEESEASPAKYDASKLEEWIKDTVIRSGEGAQASLQDPLDNTYELCRTFVVAVSQSHGDATAKLFRTYLRGEGVDTCKIWEAARATTAALPFFDAATFGDPPQTYIDGSFSGSNNPSELAIQEIADIFPSRKIGCFLSLGSGVPDITSVTPDRIEKACMKLLHNCEGVHNTVGKAYANAQVSYFRFSVDRGLGKIQVDQWQRYSELTGITDGYMRSYEEVEKAKKCVETMKAKAEEIVEKKDEAKTLR